MNQNLFAVYVRKLTGHSICLERSSRL